MSDRNFVFVYGTLMTGFVNNIVLGINPKLLGSAETVGLFTMHTNGFFPALTLEESYPIAGEVYEVSDRTLERLDVLEGYDVKREHNHYERKLITVALYSGERVNAWVYYQKKLGYGMERLQSGAFVDYADDASKLSYGAYAK